MRVTSATRHGAPDRTFTHRPALDGVRGLAVAAVIAFHLGYVWAPGGFLGVDLFFVLSGYLITSLLLTEHARTGRVDLTRFWTRRARRLLPALALVITAVIVMVPASTTPDERGMIRDDTLATLVYGANWRFAATGEAYFAQFPDPSPLRHMWSLAVEEQFYLFWPLVVIGLLALAGRRRARSQAGPLLLTCAAGVVGSAFVLAVLYQPGGDPSRAYYGTDSRVHQLLVGALLATVLRRFATRRTESTARAGRWLTPVSALLLVACFATLDSHEGAYYRGGSLLVAVAAAGLVLALEWAPATTLARALSVRPLRYVGQLSYGLYLWHWPVLIWISPPGYTGASIGMDAARLAVTFALASASYHLVEQPIRHGRPLLRGLRSRRPHPVGTRPARGAPVAVIADSPLRYFS